ncbi:MAG TPA: F0F1 ATP synthase subunit B [Casimicrobiaceae bacterium]|nr:F0F1 ATP synthase subunit B [Casimicrobiaceae bacterium]
MNINLTLLMQAIGFGLFIWFTAKFIWPPLMRAVETRQKQIAEGLQAGEQGRQSLVSAERRIADMIAEARTKAGEIVATGEKFKAETIDRAKVEAAAERDRIIAAAKAEAQQEYQTAREQLRNQVADLAVAGAAKILQREIDPRAHAELLDSIRREL